MAPQSFELIFPLLSKLATVARESAPSATDRLIELLERIAATLERIEARLRHRPADGGAGELVAALAEYFGPGFTTAGVLQLAHENPHGIGAVIAELVDLNAEPHARAVALGRLLSRLPEVEVVVRSGGVAVYRLVKVAPLPQR
jgi:hypothetical protein